MKKILRASLSAVLAFMFGLLESCKLNKVNFGEYIEDIEDGTDAEVTKTSQAVA